MLIAVRRSAVLCSRSLFLFLLAALVSCSSGLVGPPTDQAGASQVVLSPGGSSAISGTDLAVTFDAVVEDSRCPAGVNCIWAGDAIVRIRIGTRAAASSAYLLHTGLPAGGEIEHGNVRVRLVDVTPYPQADRPSRPEDYRVTLSVQKK
jgi:hypothetical protein